MEPYLWGPQMWALLWEIIRSSASRQDVIMVLQSLKWVIPCKVCRRHYREHLRRMPPVEQQANLESWVYALKNEVARGQQRALYLTEEQFKVRLATQPVLLSAGAYWDLLVVLACNYPVKGQENEDVEANMKKYAYAIFFRYLGRCLRKVPHLAPLVAVGRANKAAPTVTLANLSVDGFEQQPVPVNGIKAAAYALPQAYGIDPSTPFAWSNRKDILQWTLSKKHDWESKSRCVTGGEAQMWNTYEKQLIEQLERGANDANAGIPWGAQVNAPVQFPYMSSPGLLSASNLVL